MKRTIYEKLSQWKRSDDRKPLILKGARQTGKTHILSEFGRNEFRRLICLVVLIFICFNLRVQLRPTRF